MIPRCDMVSPDLTIKCQRVLMASLVVVGMTGFVGCNSVISLHPLHDSEHSAEDTRLLGTWQTKVKFTPPEGSEPSWRISQMDHGSYRLIIQWNKDEGDSQPQVARKEYRLKLVRLGGHLYGDISPHRVLRLNAGEEYEPLLIPGHWIFECSFDEHSLSVWPLDPEKVEQFAKKPRTNVPYAVKGRNLVLTVDTVDFQQLLQANRAQLLADEPVVFERASD